DPQAGDRRPPARPHGRPARTVRAAHRRLRGRQRRRASRLAVRDHRRWTADRVRPAQRPLRELPRVPPAVLRRPPDGRPDDPCLSRSLALARSQSSFAPLMGLIAGVGTLIVLWAGGKAVVEGRLTLGALAAFNGYLAYLTWPTIALGWTLSIVRRGLTSMARIQEITGARSGEPGETIGLGTAEPPRTSIKPPAVEAGLADLATTIQADPAVPATTSIRFENLTFAYEGRPPALRGVSFGVGAGETVAVVGPTGSGKSTLGLLLARLWEPAPGTVFVGERDVTRLPRGALRVLLGYVPQEGFLFSRAIAENITLGREDADAARVREAAVAAGVADETDGFLAGFDTVVGERGLTLSGGQRQRVALARALVARPWHAARPHRSLIAASLVLFPLISAVELAQPYLMKVAIDDYILKADWLGLTWIVALYVGVLVLLYALHCLEAYLMNLTGQ